MSGWVIIAVVAILVWGVLRFNREHNRHQGGDARRANEEARARLEAERERDELRERVQVLERIVTDANTPDALKTKRLADEIEDLRQAEDSVDQGKAGKSKEDMSK